VHICLSVTQRACIKSLKEFANSRELVHKPRRSGDTDKQGFGKPVRDDNFRMNTRYGRYGAAYSMVGLRCFNEELSLLPKNPTEAKLRATSTRGESTEPT
jgi:hypothetical protein